MTMRKICKVIHKLSLELTIVVEDENGDQYNLIIPLNGEAGEIPLDSVDKYLREVVDIPNGCDLRGEKKVKK